MNEIGGYFELELNRKSEYHPEAIKLNTGRNALEYILRVRNYKKVYLPLYTCDAVLQPLKKLKIEFEFYNIDLQLNPVFDFSLLTEEDAFLYTNYFGLKEDTIYEIVKSIANLIIDNSQSFYSKHIYDVDTFYSARKFFGVPDGAYLYCNEKLDYNLEVDNSINRLSHLMLRIENGAENGYNEYKKNEKSLNDCTIKSMSLFSQKVLSSLDYSEIATKRLDNYNYISSELKDINSNVINKTHNQIPMVYPFLSDNSKIKDALLKNRVFTPIFWDNVLNWASKDSVEYSFAKDCVFLPIDQRYTINELSKIVKIIKNEYQRK